MKSTVRLLKPGDEKTLQRVASGVFDCPVDEALAAECLADQRHHLVVALDGELVVGMCSAVHYIHPDKPAELWINEIGVSPDYRRQGIGRLLLDKMLAHAHSLGIHAAWVLTDRTNPAAMRLYESIDGVQPAEDQLLYAFDLTPTSDL